MPDCTLAPASQVEAANRKVEFILLHSRKALGLEATAGGPRGGGGGARQGSPGAPAAKPPHPRTAPGRVPAAQPEAWPAAGPSGRWPGASAGSREASGARRGARALTSGSGAARPRPRRPGSRRAARGLRRAARRTDFAASPAPDGCHVTRGRSSTGSAGPGDWREGGVSGSRRRASMASEGAGIASVGENCSTIPGGSTRILPCTSSLTAPWAVCG